LQSTHKASRGGDRWNRLSLVVLALGGAALVAAGVLSVLIVTGRVGDSGNSGPGTITGVLGDISSVLTPEASPTAPRPTPSEAPIGRLVIPRFGVDAPVVVRGVDANHVMEAPSGPTDVAWYDLRSDDSDRPGFGSNAVFSGHVDYINYGPAVFWNLKDLEINDLIEVWLEDGTVYRYNVVAKDQIDADTAPVGEIVGPTPREVITLITCGGPWGGPTEQYLQRVVVRAERVFDDVPSPAAGAAAPP
jgi:sortase (surface protein transpeptidase)